MAYRLPPDEAALIVELFADRQYVYAEEEVLRLACVSPEGLQAAVEEDELEPAMREGVRWFSWDEVAHVAFRRWTFRMVTEVLGAANALDTLPLLNQTHTIRIEVPLYQIQLLHWHAIKTSEPGAPARNASDIAAEALRELAETTVEEAEQDMPGFLAARDYPDSPPLPRLVKASCIYCGTKSSRRGQTVCAECLARHEPPAYAAETSKS